MSSRPRPLDLDGSVEVQLGDGAYLRVAGLGARVAVELPDLESVRALLAPLGSRERRARHLMRLAAALEAAELRLGIRVAELPVASFDGRWRPRLVSRALGLAPLAVRPWNALRATVRSVGLRRRAGGAP